MKDRASESGKEEVNLSHFAPIRNGYRQMVQRLAFLTMPPLADASVVRDNLVDYAYFLCRFQRDFVPGLRPELNARTWWTVSEVSGKALLPTWDHAIMAFG